MVLELLPWPWQEVQMAKQALPDKRGDSPPCTRCPYGVLGCPRHRGDDLKCEAIHCFDCVLRSTRKDGSLRLVCGLPACRVQRSCALRRTACFNGPAKLTQAVIVRVPRNATAQLSSSGALGEPARKVSDEVPRLLKFDSLVEVRQGAGIHVAIARGGPTEMVRKDLVERLHKLGKKPS